MVSFVTSLDLLNHKTVASLCILLLSLIGKSWGFYLPGVNPHNFEDGENLPLDVNKLTSVHTQLPFDYYSLDFCRPAEDVERKPENLGEFLRGDRIESSPYELYVMEEGYCNILCQKKWSPKHAGRFRSAIRRGYHHDWIVDNLPAASIMDSDNYIMTAYSGFPVGFEENGKIYIFNHVNIIIEYHDLGEGNGKRIVGFYVEPFSVKHKFEGGQTWDGVTRDFVPKLETCPSSGHMTFDVIGDRQLVATDEPVLFTYDVEWKPSSVSWASRWDVYLSMNNAIPSKVHWFSIVNSLLIVLFLTGMIAMILIRALRRDISAYNRVAITEEEKNEEREETGWKLVHTDVFRPPVTMPLIFSACVGTGVQLYVMAALSILFSAIGFLSPATRGSLMIATLLLFALMGVLAGYFSARIYKTFRGKFWQRCTIVTALGYPTIAIIIFIILDVIIWSYKSTGAVPLSSMFGILALWLFIAFPLVYIGAIAAYKKDVIRFPVSVSNMPRPVPQQPWYLSYASTCLIGGILPFGACFVELFFILSSLWMDQYYYVFGILLLVFVILTITCAEISMVLCYFQLCNEDYHWYWKSFLASGSTAFYVLAYSAIYFSKLQTTFWVTYVLYFGYMFIICLGVFLITGSVGFISCFWFTYTIYGAIKVD